ncbi:MAG: leucine-rich repeat protein [Planctomycetia bacterium]|nr:leucine-rich repeat protein [Planctomycetia bacterium]
MHGNVWEWVQDWWEPTYYGQFQNKPAINSSGPTSAGSVRVFRGGDWQYDACFCRASHRHNSGPTYYGSIIGFRVSLPVDAVRQALTGTALPKPGATNPDRRAAEYVLSIGGNISITENGQERPIAAVGDLPRGAFELTLVNLNGNQKVSDAGLANFKDCKHVTGLTLHSVQVSDAGLAHFKDWKNLTYLFLYALPVSDAGLAHFKDCKNLTSLYLGITQTDVGLAHFKNCKNLTSLTLASDLMGDAGVAHFQGCKNLTSLTLVSSVLSDAGLAIFKDDKNLTSLSLRCTQVTDAGLAHFQNCKNLTSLGLDWVQVTDAGLAHFKDCQNLTQLRLMQFPLGDAGLALFKDRNNLTNLTLSDTLVTDAGLAHFKDCMNLTSLVLFNTQVSDAGLSVLASLPSLIGLNLGNTRISLRSHEQLKAALPKCQITWFEPNRNVAESVLALGGTVEIGTLDKPESRPIKVVADMPGDYFQVRRVSLAGVTKPLDQLRPQLSLLTFPKFDRLESIDLTGITGLDYSFLVPIHGLQELNLSNAGLNDATLAQLPKLPTLKRLVLDGNDIRGMGLTHLIGQPELIDLSLSHPNLIELTAENLAELNRLQRLSLAGSGLTDAGIKPLAILTNLASLDLRRTKVTAAGIAELKAVLPKCQIQWDGKPGK